MNILQRFIFIQGIALGTGICAPDLHGQVWEHAGPFSSNKQEVNGQPNLFETSRLNLLESNPFNADHLVCGGMHAGLWATFDNGANWARIPTQGLGSNGVNKLLFLDSTRLLVANYHPVLRIRKEYSMDVGIYDFETQEWSILSRLPAVDYQIHDALHTFSEVGELFFLATSKGVFKSMDNGNSWVNWIPYDCQSMQWVRDTTGQLSGMIFTGNESTGQPVLGHISKEMIYSKVPPSAYRIAHLPVYRTELLRSKSQEIRRAVNKDCIVVLGEQRSSDDFDVFALSSQSVNYLVMQGERKNEHNGDHLMLYKVPFANSAWQSPEILDFDQSLGNTALFGARTGLVYDSLNKGIWYSGVRLHFQFDPTYRSGKFNSIRRGFHTGNGIIHDDIHELRIIQKEGKSYLWAACDGGIARAELHRLPDQVRNMDNHVYFDGVNNGLHVMLVNGFSGASKDPNFYVAGGFDIVQTDFFRTDTQRNEHTEQTWENAGGLIDQFDNSRVIIDVSLYNHHYRVVRISPERKYTVSTNRSFHNPVNPGEKPIRANPNELSGNHDAVIGFERRNFVQDPFRPGRIFYVKHKVGLHQLDTAAGLFVKKLDLAEMNPENEWAGWSNEWRWWRSVSFSPQTPNSMHIIINGSDSPENRVRNPMVIKYVGRDLDACFGYNHTRFDKDGLSQWRLISEPLFNRFNRIMGLALTRSQIEEIDLIDIETSPSNFNRVYVLLRTPVEARAKIVRYDGRRWVDYGQGLPDTEYAMSMIMDYRTDDGIYLATDKQIYYRDRSMTEWIPFTGNYPMLCAEQLEINYVENTLRAGTFGLGIWKTPLFGY
jgi:hypothetical protein